MKVNKFNLGLGLLNLMGVIILLSLNYQNNLTLVALFLNIFGVVFNGVLSISNDDENK